MLAICTELVIPSITCSPNASFIIGHLYNEMHPRHYAPLACFLGLLQPFVIFIGRAKRALHTSESQLRFDMYMFISQKFKVNACPFPAAMFKRQH